MTRQADPDSADWRLSSVAGVRRIVAVTGAANVASRRLLERLGFRVADQLPDTGEVLYTLSIGWLLVMATDSPIASSSGRSPSPWPMAATST